MAKKHKAEIVGILSEENGGPPMETDLPESKATGELKVGEFVLRAHVLTDGRRIIEKKGFDLFLEYLATGGSISGADARAVDKFVKGFSL